ncbi:hypothetical protein A4A49_32355 [Nicotiana attenuata]|uniref:Uncharacterized protein n=1 Tax=Nicotiana attenuata TaxID=49451 RepID=A0A1J6IC44_NICAT|nr:hypothetical protein A4A49_32355 [Nicotiana attenuata]
MSLDFPASKVELAGSAGIFKYPAAEQIMEDGQCQQMLKDSAKARTDRGTTAKYHAVVAAVEQVEKSDFGGSKTTVALNATGVTLDDGVTKATTAINGAANFGATAVHANLHATAVSGLDVAIFVPGDTAKQQIEETNPILDAMQQKIVNAPTAISDRHEAALISGQQQLIEKSDPNNLQIIHTYGRKATTMSKLSSNLSNAGQQQVTPAASPTNDRAPKSGQQQHTELRLPL